MRYRLTLVAAIALLAGCEDFGIGGTCTRELGVRLAPADTTIQVGQSFRASVQLSSCGGNEPVRDVITWRSADTTIATVDARTGTVAGRVPGTTTIIPDGERYGTVGHVQVTVRAVP